MHSDKSNRQGNSVSVEQVGGQWAVQIVENGETTRGEFETEEFAINFADGQRAWLYPQPLPAKREAEPSE